MNEAELERERAAYREAIQLAVRIGETLQARIDAACMMLADSRDASNVGDVLAVLEGKS